MDLQNVLLKYVKRVREYPEILKEMVCIDSSIIFSNMIMNIKQREAKITLMKFWRKEMDLEFSTPRNKLGR